MEPLAAEQLVAGCALWSRSLRGCALWSRSLRLRVVELLAGEPDVPRERLSFAALYSLASEPYGKISVVVSRSCAALGA